MSLLFKRPPIPSRRVFISFSYQFAKPYHQSNSHKVPGKHLREASSRPRHLRRSKEEQRAQRAQASPPPAPSKPQTSPNPLDEINSRALRSEPIDPLLKRATIAVTAVIVLCAAIYGYKAQLENINKPPPTDHILQSITSIFTSTQTPQHKSDLQIYRENFYCSRENYNAGRWWVLITHTFAHGNPLHLGCNMYVLWFLGRAVVQSTRSVKVLAGLWTICGIGAASPDVFWPRIKRHLPSGWIGPLEGTFKFRYDKSSIGASGAIFGLAGFMAATRPAFYGGRFLFCLAIEVGSIIVGAFPTLDHTAHLSGAGFGCVSGLVWTLLRRGR